MIRTNIRIYSYQKKDTNICGRKYSNIFEYPNIRHTMDGTGGMEGTMKGPSVPLKKPSIRFQKKWST